MEKGNIMKKSVLFGVVAVAVIVLIICIVVFSSNGEITLEGSEGLEYSLNANGKGYSVVGIGSCKDALIVIPEKYNGKPVVEIGERAFEDCDIIEKVILSDSIIAIGERAFQNCRSLESINLGKSVTNIGWFAFGWCTSLQSISFSNSVINIEQNAFCSCESLKTINYEGTITQWDSINKGNGWNNYTYTITVNCNDGKVYE